MNLLALALRFQALNLNGSDLTVKIRRESPNHRRVTSVLITGLLDKPMNEYVDAHFKFVVDIDVANESLGLCVERYEVNHERKERTSSRLIPFYDGADDFRQAKAIADTLEAIAS